MYLCFVYICYLLLSSDMMSKDEISLDYYMILSEETLSKRTELLVLCIPLMELPL